MKLENSNKQFLADVCNIVVDAVSGLPEGEKDNDDAIVLLHALARLTQEKLADNNHPSPEFFRTEIIRKAEDLTGNKMIWGKEDSEGARKKVENAYKRLSSTVMQELHENFVHRAKERKTLHLPAVDTRKGHQNRKLYKLVYVYCPSLTTTKPNIGSQILNTDDLTSLGSQGASKHSIAKNLHPQSLVEYYPERILSSFVGKALGNIHIAGWKRWAYIVPMCIVLLYMLTLAGFAIFAGIGKMPFRQYFGLLLSVCITICAVWIVVGPFWTVPNKRIVKAPQWLTPFSPEDMLLEWHVTKDKHKYLRLVRYVGRCPICNDKILIYGGGIEFFDRLVGRCTASPREHVYSFDHITRKGYSLRG